MIITKHMRSVYTFKSAGQLTDFNVIVHVFCDYYLATILIFAVLEFWLIQH